MNPVFFALDSSSGLPRLLARVVVVALVVGNLAIEINRSRKNTA